MANTVNINQNNNDVSLQDNNKRIIITDNNAGTTINVTQPVTSIVTVSAIGPQGLAGEIPSTGSFVLTSSFNELTASFNAFTSSYNTGSFSGSFIGNLNGTSSYSLTSSYVENAQTASYVEIAQTASYYNETDPIFTAVSGTFVLTSSFNSFTSSYYTDSGSFSTRVTDLENFSSSLDTTFATDAELNAATASLSESIAILSSSFEIFSGSYNTGSFTGSFEGDLNGTSSWASNSISSSYAENATSASYALTASYASNVPLTSSYALNAESSSYASTASYVELAQTASYYNETDPIFTAVSGTFVLTSSFNQFTSSYNTGSFTGSFTGDGSQLTGIVSSKWTGSNPITREGNVEITGSLNVTNGITASLYGTASWASNTISSSYSTFASTASFITSSGVYGPHGSNSILTASYAETASISQATTENRILVLNQSGQNIAKGVVVHITASGNSSDTPRIITASYENDANSANTLGITSQLIANGSTGYVTTEGVITGINTNTFQSGQLVYLGATGSIIGYAPAAPLHSVRLGQVIRHQSVNGSIYVRIDNGYELNELHDVLIDTGSLTSGQSLVRSGSVWINSNSLTGSLFGTASYALNSVSASYATSASYLMGSVTVITYIRRSDYTSSLDPNINYLYLGEAPSGSSESANVWDISRLSISSSGETLTQTTSSAAWTNRYSYTYS